MEGKWIKKVFNAYTLYMILAVVIFANVFIFPDLLNNKDMKLNDMSYLLNKDVEIVPTPINEINSVINEEKVIEIEQKPEGLDSTLTITSNNENSLDDKPEENNSSSNIESQTQETESPEIFENNSNTEQKDFLENKETLSEESDNKNLIANQNSQDTKSEEKTSDIENNIPVVFESTITEQTESNTDNANSNSNNSTPAIVEANVSEENRNESQHVVEKENTTVEVENVPFLKSAEDLNADKNTEIISVSPINENNSQEKRKVSRFYYLILLFVLLSSFLVGLSLFVHKNYEVFRQIYNSSKVTYKIRDYLYNGYELLED